MTDPRYPIGRFERPAEIAEEQRRAWIAEIAALPAALRRAAADLSDEQLDTPYRDGGWTVRQVVHHVPDSHANAYVRFKLTLTEDEPTIRPYDEKGWAETGEVKSGPEISLALLEALHRRWVLLLESIPEAGWARTYVHPDSGVWRLDQALGMYAWHGRHHLAHVTTLCERMGWT